MQYGKLQPVVQGLTSPYAKLWGLSFVSISLLASVVRYYAEITPLFGLLPFVVYISSIVVAMTVQDSSCHNRLLLSHAYVTLPLVIPLSFPLPSGFFIYISCLVVLFFNMLVCYGEMTLQAKKIPALTHRITMIVGGIALGILVSLLFVRYSAIPSLPFLLSIAALCLLRSELPEQPSLQATPSEGPLHKAWSHMTLPDTLKTTLGNQLQQHQKLNRYVQYYKSIHPKLKRFLHIKSFIASTAFVQSLPKRYHNILLIGLFILMLMILGGSYRHIILFAGTANEYLTVLYMIAFAISVLFVCFSFHLSALYLALSITSVAVCNIFFLEKFKLLEKSFSIGGLELSVETLMLISAVALSASIKSPILFSKRSKYGQLLVTHNRINGTIELINDNIIHGAQQCSPHLHAEPISYYGKQGPFGQLCAALAEDPRNTKISVIGLGIGTIAAYGRPGQTITFYEIDPEIEHIACQSGYFTYIKESPAAINIVIGDAREMIAAAPSKSIGILICDAYTGNAIPKHLLTREAFTIYLDKLEEHGIIIVDITNSKASLLPVLSKIAQDAGLVGLYRYYRPAISAPASHGKKPSQSSGLIPSKKSSRPRQSDQVFTEWLKQARKLFKLVGIIADDDAVLNQCSWAVLAKRTEDIAMLANDARWIPFPSVKKTPLWTDALIEYKGISSPE